MTDTPGGPSWRAITIGSFLLTVLVAVTWNAAALVIDSSGLEQDPESVAMAYAPLFTVVYAGWPLILSLVAAVVAGVGSARLARWSAWFSAALAACVAASLVAFANITMPGSAAETVFGVMSILLALVLVAPAVLCVRGSGGPSPAEEIR